MRRIALLFSVCLAVSVWAGNGNTAYQTLQGLQKKSVLKAKINQPAIKPFSLHEQRKGESLKAKIVETSMQSAKKEISLSELPVMRQLETLAKSTKTQRLDSIVGTYSNNGEKFSLQAFTYDENNLSLTRVNSLWNEGARVWEPVEEYGYEWDEDGYCLRQWGRAFDGNSGMRYAFTYNEKKLGVEQLISNYVNGEWILSEKGEYTYDDNGFIVDEIISLYDPDTKTWSKVIRNKASWTKLGQQTGYETYSWDGTDWIPADDKMEYAYDENGNTTLYSFNLWQNGKWVNYYRIRQEFKDNLITLQSGEYWNPIKNDWLGCYDWKGAVLYNTKTEFSYDEQGRQTDEIAYRIRDVEEGWYKTADCDFIYTPLEDGGYWKISSN